VSLRESAALALSLASKSCRRSALVSSAMCCRVLSIGCGHPIREVSEINYNPRGTLLAAADYDGTLQLWNTSTYHQ
jgi:WD40 repeat protein